MLLPVLMLMADAAAGQDNAACAKPALLNQPNISAQQLNSILERAQIYVKCMSAAIDVQRKQASETLERAKSEAEKSNAMVADVNAFVADVKAFQSEHSGN